MLIDRFLLRPDPRPTVRALDSVSAQLRADLQRLTRLLVEWRTAHAAADREALCRDIEEAAGMLSASWRAFQRAKGRAQRMCAAAAGGEKDLAAAVQSALAFATRILYRDLMGDQSGGTRGSA